ncbi:reverse transcriptase [Caerostris extrusa]|uniref:Reverse transcriptase n=1 Tax=Caerostris extrusa TaxID=172846 RepID=A0AAV4U4M4_CAEEX|nr:reverse transcriptase [Caerostris extrusa]
MRFLKKEVEGEERINLAMKGFSVKDNPKIYSLKKPMHTAAGLFAGSQSSTNCAFCNEKNHESKNCKLALNLDLQEKTTLLAKKKCCYRCFKTGHRIRQCTNKIKCSQCQRRHYNVMCPELKQVESTGSDKIVDKAVENSNEKFNTLANPTCSADVLLQTLVVYLYGNDGNFPVRALIDTGSQKSCITKETVSKMSYEPIRAEDMIHNLFWWWATLNHLLDGAPDCYKMTAQHLQKSMYVDNCVASVKSEADLTKFINESREIVALGKFELRGWQHNSLSP